MSDFDHFPALSNPSGAVSTSDETACRNTSINNFILNVPVGADIFNAVSEYASRRRIGVSILSGSGIVSSITIRKPGTASDTFTISGRFKIFTVSGTLLPPMQSGTATEFTISVTGEQGEDIKGEVAGPVIAAGMVVITGISFLKSNVEWLTEEEEEAEAETETETKEEDEAPVPAAEDEAPVPAAEDEAAESVGTSRQYKPSGRGMKGVIFCLTRCCHKS